MIVSQEPKYNADEDGRIYNRKTLRCIPDEEPIFILRARDRHAVRTMQYYANLCNIAEHMAAVQDRILQFKAFAQIFPNRMQEPGEYYGNLKTKHRARLAVPRSKPGITLRDRLRQLFK